MFSLMLLVVVGCGSNNKAQTIDAPQVMEIVAQEAVSDTLFERGEWENEEWWLLFGDCQLTEFIKTTFARNPTLKIAQANIELASSRAMRVRSFLFPTIKLGADISRQKFSETGVIPFTQRELPPGTAPLALTGGSNLIPVYFTQYETEMTLVYNFDLWKKNRNSLKAAIGEVGAKVADEAFTRLQLGIAVARVYFQLQTDYKRQEIAQERIANKKRFLDLVQNKITENLESISRSYDLETNLSATKQLLLQIQGEIEINEYKLKAYLAGDFSEEIFDTKVIEHPLPTIPLPLELPLHLVAHRPDIMAQLWLIESAGKRIEIAEAGFYPDFNLSAFFGLQTIHLHELFKWPSSNFNVDPAVSLPIFDGGRLIANLEESEINYDLAIFQYNNLVLTAAQEVLEGIATMRNLELSLQEYKNQTTYQSEIFELTKLRVENSLGSDLDYLEREDRLLTAYDQEVSAKGNMIQATLSLIKALGGGYNPCDEE